MQIYQLYAGVAALETGQFESAIRYFKAVQTDPALEATGNWYLGLCYLKMGNRAEAEKWFTKVLRDQGSKYHRQAQEILK